MERITSKNTNRALPNRNADKTTLFVQKSNYVQLRILLLALNVQLLSVRARGET